MADVANIRYFDWEYMPDIGEPWDKNDPSFDVLNNNDFLDELDKVVGQYASSLHFAGARLVAETTYDIRIDKRNGGRFAPIQGAGVIYDFETGTTVTLGFGDESFSMWEDPVTGNVMAATAGGRVYKYDGSTWSQLSGIPITDIYAVGYMPSPNWSQGTWVIAEGQNAAKSTDDGATWVDISADWQAVLPSGYTFLSHYASANYGDNVLAFLVYDSLNKKGGVVYSTDGAVWNYHDFGYMTGSGPLVWNGDRWHICDGDSIFIHYSTGAGTFNGYNNATNPADSTLSQLYVSAATLMVPFSYSILWNRILFADNTKFYTTRVFARKFGPAIKPSYNPQRHLDDDNQRFIVAVEVPGASVGDGSSTAYQYWEVAHVPIGW